MTRPLTIPSDTHLASNAFGDGCHIIGRHRLTAREAGTSPHCHILDLADDMRAASPEIAEMLAAEVERLQSDWLDRAPIKATHRLTAHRWAEYLIGGATNMGRRFVAEGTGFDRARQIYHANCQSQIITEADVVALSVPAVSIAAE